MSTREHDMDDLVSVDPEFFRTCRDDVLQRNVEKIALVLPRLETLTAQLSRLKSQAYNLIHQSIRPSSSEIVNAGHPPLSLAKAADRSKLYHLLSCKLGPYTTETPCIYTRSQTDVDEFVRDVFTM
jgi:hypothetical protein